MQSSKYIFFVISLIIFGFANFCGHSETLPSTHYKYIIIKEICQKITEAQGKQFKTPHLVVYSIDNNKQVIAQFKNTPIPTIYIDEKLYNLSRKFGKDSLDALACIIGHELAHLFEKHTFAIGMTGMMGLVENNTNNTKSISKSEKVSLETQADYYGLFYGFLAGYKTYQLLPQMLELIYLEYKLPDAMDGYPSKTERINIAKMSVAELEQVTMIVDVGEILYLQKQYEEAAIAFEYLLQKFPSRDIYNNLAAIRLSQVVSYIEKDELYFAYPFEFDALTRLRTGVERSGGSDKKAENMQKRKELLKIAKQYLKKAIILDPSYLTAYINLACVYSLEGNYELAVGTMNEAETICRENNITFSGNAYLVRAIARTYNQQIEKANEDFAKSVVLKVNLADYNYQLFKQMQADWKDKLVNWASDWSNLKNWVNSWVESNPTQTQFSNPNLEKICSQNIAEAVKMTNFGQEITVNDDNKSFKISYKKDGECEKIKIKTFDKDLYLLLTPPNYGGTSSKGILLNEKVEKLILQYGKPSYTVGCNGAEFYFYEKINLIFRVSDRKVKGWALYKIQYR
jgi:tetratricopeptide (TPR) repeat protein